MPAPTRPITETTFDLTNKYGNGVIFTRQRYEFWLTIEAAIDGMGSEQEVHLGYFCEQLGITPEMVAEALADVAPSAVKEVS